MQQYEGFVADHQQYNDAYNQCIEWLNTIREKLSLCADIAGDRHTIQNRLDKIQVHFYYRLVILDFRFYCIESNWISFIFAESHF